MIGYFKVLAAEDKGPKPNPHGGQLYRWVLSLETLGPDVQQFTNVYWQRKSEEPINIGDEFHGEVSEGQYGLRFKLTSPDVPGPRTNVQGGTDEPPRSSSTPGVGGGSAAPSDAYWDNRNARIERQHSQSAAVAYAATAGGVVSLDQIKEWTDWFAADIDNASPQNRESDPAPTGGQGQAASDSGPARHSEPDPSAPNPPCSPSQKGKVTQALNGKIAKVHHDRLRAVYGADRVEGARRLYAEVEALDASGVDKFLNDWGITPTSDVPDDPGEGPTDAELAQMGLTPTDED